MLVRASGDRLKFENRSHGPEARVTGDVLATSSHVGGAFQIECCLDYPRMWQRWHCIGVIA